MSKQSSLPDMYSSFEKYWSYYIHETYVADKAIYFMLEEIGEIKQKYQYRKDLFYKKLSSLLEKVKEEYSLESTPVSNALLLLCLVKPETYLSEYIKILELRSIKYKDSDLYVILCYQNPKYNKYFSKVKKEIELNYPALYQEPTENNLERDFTTMDTVDRETIEKEYRERQSSYLPQMPIQLDQYIDDPLYKIAGHLENLYNLYSSKENTNFDECLVDFENSIIKNPHKMDSQKYTLDNFSQDVQGINEIKLNELLAVLDTKGWLNIVGEPGTGKSTLARSLANLMVGQKYSNFTFMVSFNESTSYEDFIGGIRQVENRWVYVRGIFTLFCERALIDEDKSHRYVFVIDELNRANASGVFGEVITAIENRDYPITTNGGKTLIIPSNLKIISTCNTLDNSTSKLDDAFHSRMAEFRMPKLSVEELADLNEIPIGSVLYDLLQKVWDHFEKINNLLAKNIYKKDENRIGTRFLYSACRNNGSTYIKDQENQFKLIIKYDYIPMVERKLSGLPSHEKEKIEEELKSLEKDLGLSKNEER